MEIYRRTRNSLHVRAFEAGANAKQGSTSFTMNLAVSHTIYVTKKFHKKGKMTLQKMKKKMNKNNRTYINGLAGPEHYFATLSYVGLSHARLGLLTLGLISIV